MPVSFSKEFRIKPEVLEGTVVFDVLLDMDTRVFIDPALLELCNEPEFAGAHEKVERYFSGIITLLKHSKRESDMYWHRADQLLTFHEISGSCFGYAKNGTAGNAIGSELRRGILQTIQDLIHEGETDPTLFELLGVFQEGIGCDRISDLITFALRENIVQYTQRVVLKCKIPTITIYCEGKSIRHVVILTIRNRCYCSRP